MIETHSIFYYGTEITESNQNLNFDEGGSELTGVLAIGSYTPTELEAIITTALDGAGALTYTVTFNRAGQTFTIAATGTFALLITSGTQIGTGPFTLLGFTGADLTAAATYTGNTTAGSSYEPQFKLQSYVSDDDNQMKIDAKVNKSSDGTVEVVSFGDLLIIEADIQWATDRNTAKSNAIKNNATGVADLRAFMQSAIKKGPFEFMADIGTRTTFKKVLLESTPESKDGIGYKLKEKIFQGGPTGFYDTGLLKLRVL